MYPSNPIDAATAEALPNLGRGGGGLRESGHVAAPLCFPEIFSAAECDAILALGEGRLRYRNSLSNPVEGYRSALTLWLDPNAETQLLCKRISWLVGRVNRRYGFEVTGFRDPFLLSQYNVGDGFEWHLDAHEKDTSTRKLSFSVQLSNPDDYEGGRLEFMPTGEIPFSRERGSVIAFPSYLCHRVTRVTKGVRSAIIAWAHGPTFR